MNLQEILNYRNTCPICTEPLFIKSEESAYKAGIYDDGLKIEIGRIAPKRNVNFYMNGTYKSNTAFDAFPNYLSDVTIRKYCKKCVVKGKSTDFPAGFMSIARLNFRGYYYTFRCKIGNGDYHPEIIRELFSYNHEGSLFMMDNHFEEKKLCYSKFTTLDSRWGLALQPKLMDKYKTANDFVELMRNYMIFS